MPPWKIKLRTKRQNNNNNTKSIPPTKRLGSGWSLKSFCSSHTFISQTSLPHPMFQWPDPQRYRCPCDLADVGQGSGSGLFTRFGNHLKLVNGQWVRTGEKNHSWKEGLMQWMEENNFGNPTTPSTFRNNPVVDGTEQRIPNNQQFRRHLDLFKSCFVFFWSWVLPKPMGSKILQINYTWK